MVQVWMNIKDLKPTEKTNKDTYAKGNQLHTEGWTRESLTKSIKERGYVNYALNVNCEGYIENGNERYWVCRELYEAGDKRFEYLPVNLFTVSGLALLPNNLAPKSKLEAARGDILNSPHVPTIPPHNTFHELPDGFDPQGYDSPFKDYPWIFSSQATGYVFFVHSRLIIP